MIPPNGLGLFGGRFDPPHLGHFQALTGLLKTLPFKKIQIMPCAVPPHKPAVASIQHRLSMADLAFQHPVLEVSRVEYEQTLQQPDRPNYTFNTLQLLTKPLSVILGSDQLLRLPEWYRFPDILKLAHWVILERQGTPSTQDQINGWVQKRLLSPVAPHLWSIVESPYFFQCVHVQAPQISSQDIRDHISQTRISSLLNPEVFNYLKTHSLYGRIPDHI